MLGVPVSCPEPAPLRRGAYGLQQSFRSSFSWLRCASVSTPGRAQGHIFAEAFCDVCLRCVLSTSVRRLRGSVFFSGAAPLRCR